MTTTRWLVSSNTGIPGEVPGLGSLSSRSLHIERGDEGGCVLYCGRRER